MYMVMNYYIQARMENCEVSIS